MMKFQIGDVLVDPDHPKHRYKIIDHDGLGYKVHNLYTDRSFHIAPSLVKLFENTAVLEEVYESPLFKALL